MGSAYDLETAVDEIWNRWPTVGLAFGMVRSGQLEAFHAEGLADIASATPITEDTVFRIGSLTKTFTGIANAAVGAGTRRPRRARQSLSARLQTGPGETRLPAGPRVTSCFHTERSRSTAS